jgi:general secretion pathway protein G
MRKKALYAFTLIELLVVLAIVATLLTLVVPRYFGQTEKAKETVLQQNLAAMRDSIDRFRGDQGRYPNTLDELVQKRYLRDIPMDPVTQSRTTWTTEPPSDGTPGIYNVRSGAKGKGKNGTDYNTW